jgi:hypothetical protein
MTFSLFPIDPKLAATARRWQVKGLKGKAIAEKLGRGITTDQANLLASVGAANEADQNAALSENEIKILRALADLQRARRLQGETSSPKSWMLCRATGLSEARIRRITNKRLGVNYCRSLGLAFLTHSHNGHIWLEPPGWALVHILDAAALASGDPASGV